MPHYQYIERPSPFGTKGGKTLPVFAVTPAHIETGSIDPLALDWARKAGFKADSGSLLLIPTDDGHLGGALFGLGTNPSETPFLTGKLARALPAGDWHIETAPLTANRLLLGYGLGSYSYDRYKSKKPPEPRMLIPQDADAAELRRQLAGVFLARDLINTPTNDMGPQHLEQAFRGLAAHYKAEVSVITGDELLEKNFPLIHTVGRASAHAPRLLEMRWGKKGHRRITLVGKGVCFDTGGLDIKPSASMLLMKKDMGGAANVLGLALMIMDAKLKVDLRVLVPAVENSISGNSFRPGDVYRSRKGLSVQIDNTDAEGRLILADALALADEEPPELLIDMATLTGAARVALGRTCRPFSPTTNRLPTTCPMPRSRSTIPSGACRSTRATRRTSPARSPTSPMPPRAAWPAPSPQRCSSSASSPARQAGCISISSAGRRSTGRTRPSAARPRASAPSTATSGRLRGKWRDGPICSTVH